MIYSKQRSFLFIEFVKNNEDFKVSANTVEFIIEILTSSPIIRLQGLFKYKNLYNQNNIKN